MIPSHLQCRHFESFFTQGQWLIIAERVELSRRELAIVRLVFEDAQERTIAGELGTSINTVRTQLKRLYWKLGVRSRVGLVLRIVREHLTDSQEAEHSEPILRLRHGAREAA